MLILTRRISESLTIYDPQGKPIGEATVLSIKGNQTRIGLAFDSDYQVHRNEVVKGSMPLREDGFIRREDVQDSIGNRKTPIKKPDRAIIRTKHYD